MDEKRLADDVRAEEIPSSIGKTIRPGNGTEYTEEGIFSFSILCYRYWEMVSGQGKWFIVTAFCLSVLRRAGAAN